MHMVTYIVNSCVLLQLLGSFIQMIIIRCVCGYTLTDYYPYLIANSEKWVNKVIVSPKVNFTLDS